MAERRDESFLARWSRRKQAARAAQPEPEPQAQHSALQEPPRAPAADTLQRPDGAGRTTALPDPETLDASSDFSVFLGKDVPVETQRAALRRLWRLDPFYNRLDGLSDYSEDFTDQAKVVKGLRTAYRVGRGLLAKANEAADHPDRAPALPQRGAEAQRIAAGSEGRPSMPPQDSAQQSNPSAQQTDQSAEHAKPVAQQTRQKDSARAIARRTPRPLPKRS